MLSQAPACRAVCNGVPGDVMLELIAELKRLRARGLDEASALAAARDPQALMHLLPQTSAGELPAVAHFLVASGCAACAVAWAYGDETPRQSAVD